MSCNKIIRPASAPLVSSSFGNSFETNVIRVGKVIVTGSSIFRSMVIASSPVMFRMRSIAVEHRWQVNDCVFRNEQVVCVPFFMQVAIYRV